MSVKVNVVEAEASVLCRSCGANPCKLSGTACPSFPLTVHFAVQRGPYGSDPQPKIADPCPACGAGIFIGTGGWLTCASLKCTNPGVGDAIGKLKAQLERYRGALERIECGDPTEDRGPLTLMGSQRVAREALA